MNKRKSDIEKLKKVDFHQVPKGYFEDLPMRIQARISQKESAPLPQAIGQWIWQISAVATILLVAFYFLYPSSQTHSTNDLLAEVSTEDIISYLEEENLTEYEIASEVDFSDMDLDKYEGSMDILNDDLDVQDLESVYSDLDFSIDVL